MSGSSFGTLFQVTTWGESHGPGVGVVIDGCPAGISLTEKDIQTFLDRRKPGQSKYTTKRNESDTVEILSGVFEGRTTGTPISLMVRNQDQRSRDYGDIAVSYRPGHADFCFREKYGFRDYRGGGRSSGRETIGRVAAGAVASLLLKELGISVCAYTKSIGPYTIDEAMDDDFNTADALAAIFELVKFVNSNAKADSSKAFLEALKQEIVTLSDICGLIVDKKAEMLDSDIEALIEERQAARKAKNFARADEIRDELLAKGIVLEDTREGVKWKRA